MKLNFFSRSESSDEKSNFMQRKNDVIRYLENKSITYQEDLKTIEKAKVTKAFVSLIEKLVVRLDPEGYKFMPLAFSTIPLSVFFIICNKTFGADEQILDQLCSTGLKVQRTTDLQLSDVVFLFCPVSDRVGACVKAAMTKADAVGDKPVVLILMHHTRDPDYVTNETPWRDSFPKISGEVRVLFHETKNGLLDCPRNMESVEILKEICTRLLSKKQVNEKNQEMVQGEDLETNTQCEGLKEDTRSEEDYSGDQENKREHQVKKGMSEVDHSEDQEQNKREGEMKQGTSQVDHNGDQEKSKCDDQVKKGMSEVDHSEDQEQNKHEDEMKQGVSEVDHSVDQGVPWSVPMTVNKTMLITDWKVVYRDEMRLINAH